MTVRPHNRGRDNTIADTRRSIHSPSFRPCPREQPYRPSCPHLQVVSRLRPRQLCLKWAEAPLILFFCAFLSLQCRMPWTTNFAFVLDLLYLELGWRVFHPIFPNTRLSIVELLHSCPRPPKYCPLDHHTPAI